MRPLLLGYKCAIPYLQQTNKNRWSSNFGPLVQKLESRLADMFGTGPSSVVTTRRESLAAGRLGGVHLQGKAEERPRTRSSKSWWKRASKAANGGKRGATFIRPMQPFRAPLPVTESFGDSVLAPFTLDIKEDDAKYIMETFTRICAEIAQ